MIAAITLFAFTATSYSDEQSIEFDRSYPLAMDRTELLRLLKQIEFVQISNLDLLAFDENLNVESGAITINTRFCKNDVRAHINLATRPESSTIELKSIDYRCDAKHPTHEAELLDIFERRVIRRITEIR